MEKLELKRRIRQTGQLFHEITGVGGETEKDIITCRSAISEVAARIGMKLDTLSEESAFKVELSKGPIEIRLFPEPNKPPAVLVRRLTEKHVYGNPNSRVYLIYLIDNDNSADSLLAVKYHETPGYDINLDALTSGKFETIPHLYTGFDTPSNWHNGIVLNRKLAKELKNNPEAQVSPLSVMESEVAFLQKIREVAPIYCY